MALWFRFQIAKLNKNEQKWCAAQFWWKLSISQLITSEITSVPKHPRQWIWIFCSEFTTQTGLKFVKLPVIQSVTRCCVKIWSSLVSWWWFCCGNFQLLLWAYTLNISCLAVARESSSGVWFSLPRFSLLHKTGTIENKKQCKNG